MELSSSGVSEKEHWIEKGYTIPNINRKELIENTKKNPEWVHFGAGNIFRAFPAMLQQELIEKGIESKGIIVAEGYDYEIIDKVDNKNDGLSIIVTLKNDGEIKKNIVESITESLKLNRDCSDYERLKEIFRSESLQMASFTITEKGYSLKDKEGRYLKDVLEDFKNGPTKTKSYIGKIVSLCYERYKNGKLPLALVSMDNCSENGSKLKAAIEDFAYNWYDNRIVSRDFYEYITNRRKVTYPWSMIDKITPRPSEDIKTVLVTDGISNAEITKTSKNTYISNFVNAEECQYLVIEDDFPNGRPKLEAVGVKFTTREQVVKTEKMKVGTCLNPVHTTLAILGCLLSYKSIHDEMQDEDLKKFVENMVFKEGIKVVEASDIMDPMEFVNDVLYKRLPNPFIPDTPQRIATDTSKKVGVRFIETIKSYVNSSELDASSLEYIPFVLAAWLRYLLGVNDEGEEFEISPDPMLSLLKEQLKDVTLGTSNHMGKYVKTVLGNKEIFEIDLYEIGLGEKIENYFKELVSEKGSVRRMVREVISKND